MSPTANNSMVTRTDGCIALLPTGNLNGSVVMLNLRTHELITRDQFTILPMPSVVVEHLDLIAQRQGYGRQDDEPTARAPATDPADTIDLSTLPAMQPIQPNVPPPANTAHSDQQSAAGVISSSETAAAAAAAVETEYHLPTELHATAPRRSTRSNLGVMPNSSYAMMGTAEEVATKAALRRHLAARSNWTDHAYAFHISVKAAMRERGAEATPVIFAEVEQMLKKGVWHGVHTKYLSAAQRRGIIRSSMFLKDKYLASGAFEKFKARLVAGGDQQDKDLYENLSSPCAATSSVLCVAAIAAAEERIVMTIDIGGAYLNVDLTKTGVIVLMRLDKIMTKVLVQLDPSYQEFVEENGTCVVQLDKALYGCVEAAALWFEDLTNNLKADGFVPNAYDICVMNKAGTNGDQTTIVIHVDDLLCTSAHQTDLDALRAHLCTCYPEVNVKTGQILDYIGITFDFKVPGEVGCTMSRCTEEVLEESGVTIIRATPATASLFDVREDAAAVPEAQRVLFHSRVAKILYLAKRVRPECLTTVSFLSTRVHVCDTDDWSKLQRLLGYLAGTRDRGIVLRIGDHMSVNAYVDAAYGVHTSTGRSHTGCAIVLGAAGPVFAKSCSQKNVTKSSTEAELVAASDSTSQAIYLRNFVIEQGYDVPPCVLYQDNLSCMALMKRGAPASERSRHIAIRHFWISEKQLDKEVSVVHLGTADMFANMLTKPVQGAQFLKERTELTNWA
jgi:hypothetical protein